MTKMIGRRSGNNPVQGVLRGSKRSYLTNDRVPKDDNTSRKSFCQNGSPLPMFGDLITETVYSIRVCSGFHKTDDKRLKSSDKTKNPRRGVPRRDTPAIPT